MDHLVKSALIVWITAYEELKDHGLKSAYSYKIATLKSEEFCKVMETKQVLINVQLKLDSLNIEHNK